MLQAIRDHLTGWVAVVLFIVIGLAFALWGVPNQITGNAAAAEVNGEEIPLESIRRAVRNQLAQFAQYSDLSPEYEKLIREQVLQGMVMEEVLSQHTLDTGYYIGNDALVTHVRNMQEFQDQGEFSMELYNARLAPQGLSKQYFEEQVRRSLRISQLREGIIESAFVTQTELQQRARLEREQRKAEWIQLSVDAESDQIEIDDEAVEAHYQANTDLYMAPEMVDISYVELNLENLADESVITDAELEEFYQSEVSNGRFQEPEERQARHILISVDGDTNDEAASEQIQGLLERLQNGEDFAVLAAEFSDDPGSGPEGGDLGWAQRSAYVGPFADALFSMESGDLSEPVRTQFGYHLIKMEGQRGGVPKPLEEVSTELREELSRRLAEGRYYDRADQMRDLGFESPGSLQPIADALDLEIVSLAGVTRTGGQGVVANPAVIDAVFSEFVLEERQNSDPIDLTTDTRVVVRVDDHHPAEVRPLEEVRETIVATLRSEAARKLVSDQGQAVLGRVRAGEALSELAEEYGAQYNGEDTYRRTAGLATELRKTLFEAARPVPGGQTTGGVALADGSYAVFALKEVIPGDIENLGAADAVAGQQGLGDLSAYLLALRDDASVQVRPEMLE